MASSKVQKIMSFFLPVFVMIQPKMGAKMRAAKGWIPKIRPVAIGGTPALEAI